MSEASDTLEANRKQLSDAIGGAQSLKELIARDVTLLSTFGKLTKIADLPKQPNIEFNAFLAETLLRDGCLLVDRCLQHRRELDELLTKRFEAEIQIFELLKLSKIATEEESQYHEPAKVDELNARAEGEAADGNTQSSKAAQDALAFDQGAENFLRQKTRSLEFHKVELTGNLNKAAGAGQLGTGEPIDGGWVRDMAYWAADRSVEHQFAIEQHQLRAQIESANAQIVSGRTKKEALEAQAKYRHFMADHQTTRNDVARSVATRRALAFITRGGPLDYASRIARTQSLFAEDLAAALPRLSAAAEGFKTLYGYDVAQFPSTANDVSLDFNKLTTWCQRASVWLAAFQDGQQLFTQTINLVTLMGEAEYNKQRQKSRWTFNLEAKHFPSLRSVRLRAMSIVVVNNELIGTWNVKVTPPAKADYLMPDGSATTLNQTHAGDLFLGRVNEHVYQSPADAITAAKLQNLSPLGTWVVEFSEKSTRTLPSNRIADIELQLTVVGL